MKRILIFFLITALILSLCACSKNTDSSGGVPSDDSISGSSNVENTTDVSSSDTGSTSSPVSSSTAASSVGSSDITTNSPIVSDEVTELEAKYSGLTEDELTWSYDDSTKTLTISGEGPMRDYMSTEPEWYQYYDTTEHIIIGDNVTSVSAGAFMWFMTVTDATLGSSIEFIGDFAFDECYCLRNINFPTVLKYVGEGAFSNALLHTDSGFVFPEGILYLDTGSFFSAFKESYVYIPASLTYIGENAFANCFLNEFQVSDDNPAYTAVNGILYDKNITTLINYPSGKTDTVYEIPESVTTVLDESIEITNTLEKIVIPANVSYIDEGAFFWNYALTTIEVNDSNPNYKVVDNVLYTADGKTLLCYPIADTRTEYTIPDGCERIGMAGISYAANLTAINIPDSLKEIGLWGMCYLYGVSQLTLPEGMTKIEAQAFIYCDNLKTINYAGSNDSWQNIEIDENNTNLTDGSISIICAK